MAQSRSRSSSRVKKEGFKKRRMALVQRARSVTQDGAEVYLLLRRNDRCYVYTTSKSAEWPPPASEFVSLVTFK